MTNERPETAGAGLFETMRLEDRRIVRLAGHLARLSKAAHESAMPFDQREAERALDALAAAHPTGRWRVRLTLRPSGTVTTECFDFPGGPAQPWRVGFAAHPVKADDSRLRVKTTDRHIYESARQSAPGMDDVLLWTPDGLVTESTIANIVIEGSGGLVTPPVPGPLLPGIFRGELVASGRVRESPITKKEVLSAANVWLVNSLREWVAVTVQPV